MSSRNEAQKDLAPGPDGITTVILKDYIKAAPEIFSVHMEIRKFGTVGKTKEDRR